MTLIFFLWLNSNGFEESFFNKLWDVAPSATTVLTMTALAAFMAWRLAKMYTENQKQHALTKLSIEHLNEKVDKLEEKFDKRIGRLEEKMDAKFDRVFEILMSLKK